MVGTNSRNTVSGTVDYDGDSHLSVLFQMYGSVWCNVLPYCLLNVLISLALIYLQANDYVDLGISDKGHAMMSLIVSFLVVTRVSLVLNRFMEARNHLSVCFKNCRDLIQTTLALTQYEQYESAREWRSEIAYRTMLLLRVTVAMTESSSSKVPSWEAPEVCQSEREYLKTHLFLEEEAMPLSQNGRSSMYQKDSKSQRWAHKQRTTEEENLRVPIMMAFRLRLSIASQKQLLEEKLAAPDQLKLLGFVDGYMNGYSGLRKLLSTPFPFPLVQMARTFLFFYVFTLPFALLGDQVKPVAHICIIFIMTYGFAGLESVSMELDDPFGEDPNDLDDLGMAYNVFEDIYLTVSDIDGMEYADKLRSKMHSNKSIDHDSLCEA